MARRFDFVSPGVQLNEVDRSQIIEAPPRDGLVLIGRARSGPAMQPIEVRSWAEWKETFGTPFGGAGSSDSWRHGNTNAPNYAAYAAQAYLGAGVGPVKYIRLLGLQSPDATTDAEKPGWKMGSTITTGVDTNAAAYGLFMIPSASTPTSTAQSATLAAIFYVSGASITLSGSATEPAPTFATIDTMRSGSYALKSDSANYGFTLSISSSGGAMVDYPFDFNQGGSKYIRDVFNTRPDLIRATANYNNAALEEKYFLGETFDVNLQRNILPAAATSGAGKVFGFIMGLNGSGGINADDFKQEFVIAKTGWFIGNKTGGGDQKKLFRLVALDGGEEFQNKYYCVIGDIALGSSTSPAATFSISIMERSAGGGADSEVEKFSGLNFDVNNDNYILKRIGNISRTWNKTTKQFDEAGLWPNISTYFRVEMAASHPSVSDYPFGWAGQKLDATTQAVDGNNATNQGTWFDGNATIPLGNASSLLIKLPLNYTASLSWPVFGLTDANSNTAGYSPSMTFGLRHMRNNGSSHDPSFADVARKRKNFTMHIAEGDALSTASQVFTIDDITSSTSSGFTNYYYESGQYAAGTSLTKLDGVSSVLALGIRQFAAPFFGGADGVDITYVNPFSNARLGTGGANYPIYSAAQAVEMLRSPENIRFELASMPGIVNSTLTDELMSVCSTRGDALAIIDVDGIYRPTWDMESSEQAASVSTATSQITTRNIDNSYAATYFPTVRIQGAGISGILQVPPSVAGIGAIAKSEDLSHPWFAPAGFNRGGLSNLGGPNSGLSVTNVDIILNKNQRDDLYNVNINPIAKFPSTNDIVMFGQKTLQTSFASALDRINVRRLLIYLKRQIGVIADTILFDQNVQVTWNRFKSAAEAVLSATVADLGITEYRIVLDETTTTPDLIDRNILYAQIYIKPARAIEFIAIDFIITQTGVEF